ncbi:hypothetical protein [Oceanicoccus sp. KOV_DT_Chl]|uniref:hypothetical protein n=1 Tax=Oceanicoccus sp. KOV_DT_Chl TaxID=1904639 RepID=UPI000C7A7BBD|nr:hypothetical protein [Oceanicoccus sp. KOV_DT_Chl]
MNNVLSNKAKVDSYYRQAERLEIERQVQSFLENGGQIEQLPKPVTTVAPKSKAWPTSFGSFEA